MLIFKYLNTTYRMPNLLLQYVKTIYQMLFQNDVMQHAEWKLIDRGNDIELGKVQSTPTGDKFTNKVVEI